MPLDPIGQWCLLIDLSLATSLYTSCHVARSTLVMLEANNVHKIRWSANILDLNSIDDLLDLLKRKVGA